MHAIAAIDVAFTATRNLFCIGCVINPIPLAFVIFFLPITWVSNSSHAILLVFLSRQRPEAGQPITQQQGKIEHPINMGDRNNAAERRLQLGESELRAKRECRYRTPRCGAMHQTNNPARSQTDGLGAGFQICSMKATVRAILF